MRDETIYWSTNVGAVPLQPLVERDHAPDDLWENWSMGNSKLAFLAIVIIFAVGCASATPPIPTPPPPPVVEPAPAIDEAPIGEDPLANLDIDQRRAQLRTAQGAMRSFRQFADFFQRFDRRRQLSLLDRHFSDYLESSVDPQIRSGLPHDDLEVRQLVAEVLYLKSQALYELGRSKQARASLSQFERAFARAADPGAVSVVHPDCGPVDAHHAVRLFEARMDHRATREQLCELIPKAPESTINPLSRTGR